MVEALSFEGFQDDCLLVQQYVPHYEKVFKVYAIGKWFSPTPRLSIPHAEMTKENAVKFDSQKPFDKSLFTEYDTEVPLDMSLMQEFFDAFYKHVKLRFFGVDILVDSRDQTYNLVDCNYLSNYRNISDEELWPAVKDILDEFMK